MPFLSLASPVEGKGVHTEGSLNLVLDPHEEGIERGAVFSGGTGRCHDAVYQPLGYLQFQQHSGGLTACPD